MSNCDWRSRVFLTGFLPSFARALAFSFVFAPAILASPASTSALTLMPWPAEVQVGSGELAITGHLTVALHTHDDPRLRHAIERWLLRWEARTGLTFAHTANGEFAIATATATTPSTLVIDVARSGAAIPTLGEDESYTLAVTATQATLRASTDVGALHGLQTLAQLLRFDATGWAIPTVNIRDQPRFAWRGLMIDVARHWQPIAVIKRNLDGMESVKLNVLHLHLTDDQGFRIESKRSPRLQEFGSDGHYFTQDQIRDIIAYAADRGIRVVPEFDVPGHATSWVVAFPELASGPGPYEIERRWGVFDPVLDPTNEKTYELLDGFFGEMAALFPDAYLHIGGDENNGRQWNANPQIQAFIRKHKLKDNEGLHAYFNRRVREILQRHGKKLVGWDEILHPDLPNDSVIQSWRGEAGLSAAASQGFRAILSNGYYIDLCHSAAEHYLNDPIPPSSRLAPAEQKRILGGEATMWSEWVSPETIDSRIWPRTAAIAERLWSPQDINNVSDMYRRLAIVSQRLEEAGLQHETNRPPMIRRLVGNASDPELLRSATVLIDAVEPVKDYQRGQMQPDYNQFTPLTGIADCARPESEAARSFANAVDDLVFGQNHNAATTVRADLSRWRSAADYVVSHATIASPRVQSELTPVANDMSIACAAGDDVLAKWQTAGSIPHASIDAWFSELDRASTPHAAVFLPMIKSIRVLVAAVALNGDHAHLSDAEWRKRVEELAAPSAPPKAVP